MRNFLAQLPQEIFGIPMVVVAVAALLLGILLVLLGLGRMLLSALSRSGPRVQPGLWSISDIRNQSSVLALNVTYRFNLNFTAPHKSVVQEQLQLDPAKFVVTYNRDHVIVTRFAE